MFVRLMLSVCLAGLMALAPRGAAAAAFTATQTIVATNTGEGAPARGFGTQVAVDGDLAVVSDLASTLDVRRATVRTYVRVGTTWQREGADLTYNTGSPSNVVKLALGDGTLVVNYPAGVSNSSQTRIYRRVNGAWVLEYSSGSSNPVESVAVDGFIAVLGVPGPPAGFLRVLRRDNTGTWNSTVISAPTPSPSQTGQRFGQSVAIVAGAIAVGAPALDVKHSINPTVYTDAGGAYVFELTIDTWNLAATLVEPDADLADNNGFGRAVAINGADESTPDRLLVSSTRKRNSVAALVRSYTQTNDVWIPRQVFTSAQANTDDAFGCSLALDGDWAVIGACDSNVTANRAGKVTVMRFASNFQSVLSSTDRFDAQGTTNDAMGSSVSIDRNGPTMFVGSPGAEVYGPENTGEGVVMIGRGGEFSDPVPRAVRRLDLGQGLTNANFGSALSIDGDWMAVGAPWEDVTVQSGRGAVYLEQRNGSGLFVEQLRLLAPDGQQDDQFGGSVALKGDVLLVGAPNRSVSGVHEAGMVYAFRRVGTAWNLEAQVIAPTPTASGGFGAEIAFDGARAVFCGRLSGMSWAFDRNGNGTWTFTQEINQACNTVRMAGDMMVLGDPSADLTSADVGKVSTYLRDGAGQWQFQGAINGSNGGQRFGFHVALDGDLMAVSSIGAGALPVQVFRRGSGIWLPETSLLPADATVQTYCVNSAIGGGRIVVGCSNQPGPDGPGAAYVFDKSTSSWAETQTLTFPTSRSNDRFGGVLAMPDAENVLIAAPNHATSFFGQGVVYRYAEPPLFSNGFE